MAFKGKFTYAFHLSLLGDSLFVYRKFLSKGNCSDPGSGNVREQIFNIVTFLHSLGAQYSTNSRTSTEFVPNEQSHYDAFS